MKWKAVGLHVYYVLQADTIFFFPNSVIKSESSEKKREFNSICIFQANSTVLAKVFLYLALQMFIAM